jgi:hypothetical protein
VVPGTLHITTAGIALGFLANGIITTPTKTEGEHIGIYAITVSYINSIA